MDAVEITRRQMPIFEKCSVLYVECIDCAAEFNEAPKDLPFLYYKMLLGHVNFPDELQNRRMALFPNTGETKSEFRNLSSPAVINVTASSIVKLAGEKEVCLIYDWKVLDNLSVTAVAMKPVEYYEVDTTFPFLPWLDISTPVCNCSRFPNTSSVLVNENNTSVYTMGCSSHDSDSDRDNSDNEIESCGSEAEKAEDQEECVGVMGEGKEEQCYAEKMALKGCSYHEQFQNSLKKCQRVLAANDTLEIRLFVEPVNLRDDNAIVAQAKIGGNWQSLGYIPAKKIPKVTAAMDDGSIISITLVRVYRRFIYDIGAHRYFGDIVMVKRGRWNQDADNYNYNDRPTPKFNS